MKISVIAPVKNEAQFIGYSIMAALPYVHEILYACAPSTDGTDELLAHIQEKYAKDKLKLFYSMEPGELGERAGDFNFHPHDMQAYNASFNYLIHRSTGDACFFLHPDMIITQGPKEVSSRAMAWFTSITSYAGDLKTVITKGRTTKWKNLHRKKLGLHYFGGYGSQNEDFYHSDVTGKSYKHYGSEFSKYPFLVEDSGIRTNHYCENKDYKRRLEKMKLCLETLYPDAGEDRIDEMAIQHPRVSLEPSSTIFGEFAFEESKEPIPHVFERYEKEFSPFNKGALVHA